MTLNSNRTLFLVFLAMIILAGFSGMSLAEESDEIPNPGNIAEIDPLPVIENPDAEESTVDSSDDDSAETGDLIVKAIEFQGNMRISDEQIIAVMATRPGRPFSNDEIEDDITRISEMGFFQAPPKYNAEPMGYGVKIIIFLKENPLFTRLDIKVTGPGLIPIEELIAMFDYEPGQIISTTHLIDKYEKIENAYREEGYTAASITNVDYDDDGVVYIEINEGIINEIQVEGNTKTRDIVILREISLNPGDVYDAIQFRRDLENIFALQIFEDISVNYELTDEQEIIVIIVVTEARTGQFGVGGGYSSQDGILGTLSYTERNFRGLGQRVNFVGQFGGPDPDLVLSFYSPQIDKKRTSMTADVFYTSNTDRIRNLDDPEVYTKFTIGRKGGSLGFTRPMTSTLDVTTKLTFLEGNIDVEEGEITEDQFDEYAQRGLIEGTSNSLMLGISKDTRDFILDPSTGHLSSLTGTYYGLGGDFNALKAIAEYRTYFNLKRTKEELVTGIDPSRFHSNTVFAFRIMVGGSTGDLSIFDSFKIGGQDTVRGAEEALQVGNHAMLMNAEFRFPVITNLSGAAFIDSGTAAPLSEELDFSNLVTSVGLGIRYRIPFFGIAPLRLDYGWDIDAGTGRISFGFGQLF